MGAFTLRQENSTVLVYPADEVHAHEGNCQLHHFYTLSSTDGHHFPPVPSSC